MRRTKTAMKFLAVALAAIFLTACGAPYETYNLKPDATLDLSTGPADEKEPGKQLTAADIQKMNDGKAMIVYGEEGYVTFIKGRFSDVKVSDYEEAITALYGIETLIGLGKGSEFFCESGSKDDDGYTYYTFRQRYGDVTVQYATLKIVVAPDGYTAGLACSFVPNMGIADEVSKITAQEAVQVVRDVFPTLDLTYYEEETHEVAVTLNGISFHAWVVYTNNPESSNEYYGMTYYEHFIAADGSYLYNLPVASFESTNADAFQAEKYFDGLDYYTLNGTVTTYDGKKENISLPIAYNKSTGRYYLMDNTRKIAVASYYDFCYNGIIELTYSEDGVTWNNEDLLVYDRYIKAYDFYASMGVYSVDGCGMPILICTGYCDQNGQPVDNACYFGNNSGWAMFAASYANHYSQAVDVTTHEFTHGVTNTIAGRNKYSNESGAINEAYSDIMGNLNEMMNGYTTDTKWLLDENGGEVFRSMSSPRDYYQPVSVYDKYYQATTTDPNNRNDYGGVHQNSSLLAQMAYKLYEAGMPLRDECAMWLTSIELITPTVGYTEVYAALIMSLEINGFDEKYQELLTDAFLEAGLIEEDDAWARN